MALQVTTYKRKFVYEKDNKEIVLPDPGTNIIPDKVADFYAAQYPELINAHVEGPELDEKEETALYTISVKAGTKG